jgi:hypothetical protein
MKPKGLIFKLFIFVIKKITIGFTWTTYLKLIAKLALVHIDINAFCQEGKLNLCQTI